jgi:hypothetical protein
MKAAWAWLAVVGMCGLAPAQSARHPFTFGDAAGLRRAEARAVSPDGKAILYEVNYGSSKGPENSEWRLIGSTGKDSRNLNLPH